MTAPATRVVQVLGRLLSTAVLSAAISIVITVFGLLLLSLAAHLQWGKGDVASFVFTVPAMVVLLGLPLLVPIGVQSVALALLMAVRPHAPLIYPALIGLAVGTWAGPMSQRTYGSRTVRLDVGSASLVVIFFVVSACSCCWLVKRWYRTQGIIE